MSTKEVKKYYTVTYDAGFCGTEVEVLNVEAESEEDAVALYTDEAWQHYWNYNEEPEEPDEDDDNSFDVEPELNISATLQDGFIAEEGTSD